MTTSQSRTASPGVRNVGDNELRHRNAAATQGGAPDATDGDPKQAAGKKYAQGTNWVEGGVDNNPSFLALLIVAPFLALLISYLTSQEMAKTGVEPNLSSMVPACYADLKGCGMSILSAGTSVLPTAEAAKFVFSFMVLAFLLDFIPGKTECGPETLTGHVPKYTVNGVRHCLAFSLIFFVGSNLGPGKQYDFGIFFDLFPAIVAVLNLFGMVFCVFLMVKGLYFPSTQDSGSTGSLMRDYLWGTELYPRILGFDLKRFINSRFSMTFWMLAGLSYTYRSYTLHKQFDYGLLLSSVSQYIYLFKFFWWEMGYMRSIDIIVDRAGFTIQWGCLVWVPSVYTLHTRFLVLHPSGLSIGSATFLFVLSLLGVVLNYAADRERDVFRATGGKCRIWGKEPNYISAECTIVDPKTGKETKKVSLLLASGFWGIARHFQYLFELIAAWSWCLLSNPFKNGAVPLFYCVFLTWLLVDRAKRDSNKCHMKYGKFYEEYCRLVPYKILPGVY
mmetsp:Transcript_35314/g.68080  ORF Transcript_35314/g.68080 Transcript_35314/m.68080 type:complete len:503 (+) Transcript_35314:64-1572(+)